METETIEQLTEQSKRAKNNSLTFNKGLMCLMNNAATMCR